MKSKKIFTTVPVGLVRTGITPLRGVDHNLS
jgi:hypothetical protein